MRYSERHGAHQSRVALSQPLTEVIGMSIAVLILWIGAKRGVARRIGIGRGDAHRRS